jgi:hypothetical protein
VLLHCFLRGPVVVTGEPRPFEKIAPFDALEELLLAEIEVVPPFDLVGAPIARSGRDRADKICEPGQDLADESAFARAGRTGDDDESRDDRS